MPHVQKEISDTAHSGLTPKQSVKEAQWAGLIHQCQTSGQTIKVWCRSNGINENTYYYWLKRLRKKAIEQHPTVQPVKQEKAPAIVEIPRTVVKAAKSEPPTEVASIRLSFRGARMTIENGTSPELLRMVLSELNQLAVQ